MLGTGREQRVQLWRQRSRQGFWTVASCVEHIHSPFASQAGGKRAKNLCSLHVAFCLCTASWNSPLPAIGSLGTNVVVNSNLWQANWAAVLHRLVSFASSMGPTILPTDDLLPNTSIWVGNRKYMLYYTVSTHV